MTALTRERLTPFAGLFPARATLAIAALVLIFKGAMVAADAAGRAVPAGTAGAVRILGKSSATYDNRTGSELGGAAGATDVEVECGVHGWANSGGADAITAVHVGRACFAVDDQTVALTDGGGTRLFAGVVSEVRGSKVYVHQGPSVGVPSALAYASIGIPLTSFVDADGDPLAKFASAASPTFGLNLADSEAFGIRWNNDATPGTALCQISLPDDLDESAPMNLEFLCSKSGATVGDATTLTVTAFLLAEGSLHDADANAGGVSNALVGNAAAKTTDVLAVTIAAADIPAGARTMTFTVTPTAGLLGTDDLILHEARLRYARRAA